MPDEDLYNLRLNAWRLLEDPIRGGEAENVLNAIDAELKHRYLPGMIALFGRFTRGASTGRSSRLRSVTTN
jgi:hypothetical protein